MFLLFQNRVQFLLRTRSEENSEGVSPRRMQNSLYCFIRYFGFHDVMFLKGVFRPPFWLFKFYFN
jgi:hypothetical protein